jgi:hypothetical protein
MVLSVRYELHIMQILFVPRWAMTVVSCYGY